jgi:hypothetical protein
MPEKATSRRHLPRAPTISIPNTTSSASSHLLRHRRVGTGRWIYMRGLGPLRLWRRRSCPRRRGCDASHRLLPFRLPATPHRPAPISIATIEPARAARREDRQAPEQSNDLGRLGKWIGGEAKSVRPGEVVVREGGGGAGSPVQAAAAVAAPE